MKNLTWYETKHIHFVGIGGAGMSAIAEILHNLGYVVSGSDACESPITGRLQALGLRVFIGHAATHINGAQAVVTSTAVKTDNPEVLAARANRIPVVPRAVLLAELMRQKQGIAIAGTHGKTTTTSLVASVLAQAGLDPTFVIGGKLQSAGANSRLGAGDYIVVEADESDASFLYLSPIISVITNIDADHMETYDHDITKLHAAFIEFIHRLPFYGRAILCIDDAGVKAILPKLNRPVITYGFDDTADIRASDVQAIDGGKMQFTAHQKNHADQTIILNLAGEHNVRNALAAIAVASVLELADMPVSHALRAFAGVGRRFEHYGEVKISTGTFTLIDDYGHHPVELAAVLAASRGAYPKRRLVIAFQPHRYTRTRDCFAQFVAVLSQFDCVLLAEVYAASEAPIAGANGESLAVAVLGATFIADVDLLPDAILNTAKNGDVVLVMGAGSIGDVAEKIVARAN